MENRVSFLHKLVRELPAKIALVSLEGAVTQISGELELYIPLYVLQLLRAQPETSIKWNEAIKKCNEVGKFVIHLIKFEKKSMQINFKLVEYDGDKFIFAHFYDFTEVKNVYDEIEKKRIYEISQSRLVEMAQVAGGISHEINNPLTVIVAKSIYLNNLFKNITEIPQKERVLDALGKIVHHSDRITKIVKALKNFSRDGSKDPVYSTSICGLLDDALILCTEKLKNNGTEVVYMEIPNSVQIDCRSVEIVQILVNLLSNAQDALSGISLPKIEIFYEVMDGLVDICIRDNGPGVPLGIEDKIFQPFFTTKDVGKGTGLGLSISHQIAKNHNGLLMLDRKRGNSCFVLRLPLSKSSKRLTA